jgi:putative metal-binding protein
MHIRVLFAVSAAAILAACGGGGSSGGGGGVLTVSTAPSSVQADGTSTTTITVIGVGAFPVTILADRGTFSNGQTSMSFQAAPVSAVLRSCDSRTVQGCAGAVQINAADASGKVGGAQVAFVPVELCTDNLDNDGDGAVDCADLAACPAGTVCSAGGRQCGGGTCSVCSGKGGAPEPAAEVSCGDGFDNDCDGLSDCADPDCAGDVCNSAPSTTGGTTTGTCNATTKACVCTSTSETAAKCADTLDNDCDGLIDGEDANCVGMPCDTRGNLWSAPVAGVSTCSVCSGNGGSVQVMETDCADGHDNDCDGLADCGDPDCATSTYACKNATFPTAPGWICSAAQSTCSTCTGNGGASESAEATCGDGFDNDCDGTTDCGDVNCRNQACNAFGMKCTNNVSANTCTVCSAAPAEQPKELSCGDAVDNDCDGRLDCADVDCQPAGATPGKSCGASGRLCTAAGACACSGNGGVAEAAEATCGDGKDNDCDGLADCTDPDCQPAGAFAGGACGANGRLCTAAGACACSGNGGVAQAAEASCSDGFDNDCDGTTDCADTTCAGVACTISLGGGLTTAGACSATTKVCTCTPVAETGALCGDGKDNDCDGATDCGDASCQPVGNGLGQPCDARGNRCSPVSAGVSACSVCAPGGDLVNAQAPGAETRCGDNLDNDCDGKMDCQDANCAALTLTCSTSGKQCSAALLCVCPDTSGVETSCADGRDNDCDGKVDCADANCQPVGGNPGFTCGANGLACTAAGACACSGNGGAAQASETNCADGFDNDCDGLADCADPSCQPATPGTLANTCRTGAVPFGGKCDVFGQCVCPGGQARETTCNDGLDNDCDGLPDCADPDCTGLACLPSSGNSVGTTCLAVSPTGCGCPGGQAIESTCNDGVDNDCDGKADCADADCANLDCQQGSTTYKCRLLTASTTYVCKDTSSFVLTVTPVAGRLPADGSGPAGPSAPVTTAVNFSLQDATSTPVPVVGATLDLTASGGTLSTASVITGGDGKASATFTPSTTAQTAVVTATYAVPDPDVVQSANVVLPALSSITLAAQDFTVMGARNSGYQELNELTFLLADATGQPYPAGLRVDFEHAPAGGSFIEVTGQPQSCTVTLCTTHGVTDATGKVRVQLHSGSVATTLAVTARASAGGTGLKTVTAGNIAVVGAKASGNQITITCSPQNVPALIARDCTNSSYFGSDATVSCQVVLADRYGLKLGVPTLVQFFAEAGAMGPSATTPPYDPAKSPAQQIGLGTATGVYGAAGAKLPADVTPQLGEKFFVNVGDACAATPGGSILHNPRDGLVTVYAAAQGEEGFFDGSNGCPANGLYDAPGSAGCATGERFVDLGEPYLDINDDGRRDSIAAGGEFDEPYFDANNNGSWDGPNGGWDANTIIWAETRILYTGYVERAFDGGDDWLSRMFTAAQGGTLPDPTAWPSFTGLLASTTTPAPGTPPESRSYGVFMTDLNLNRPNYKNTYGVSKSAGAKFTVVMNDAPTTVDGLGMLFRQLYCDGSAPASCATSCNWTQCVRRSDITSFEYGSFGSVTITAGNAAESGCAWVTASLRTTNTISGISTERSIDIPICGQVVVPTP